MAAATPGSEMARVLTEEEAAATAAWVAEAKAKSKVAASSAASNAGEVQEAQSIAVVGQAPEVFGWLVFPTYPEVLWTPATPAAPGPMAAAAPEAKVEAQVATSGQGKDSYDMSLDDIIKLHRKKQAQDQAERNGRREHASNTNQTSNQTSEFSNGPQRLKKWFGRQNNYRRTNSNSSKPRAFPSITRRIPLARNNAASEESGNSESTGRQFKNQNSRSERLGRQLTLGPASKSLPSDSGSPSEASGPVVFDETLADRTIKQKQQRENKVNQNRGIPPRVVQTSEGKYPSESRYQVQIKPGSVLTVSVANPQVGQNKRFKRTDGETSFPKDKRNLPKTGKFQPKGISLRYNFRAMANQTKITLNERFSGLKMVKGDFGVTKPGNRTVTLS